MASMKGFKIGVIVGFIIGMILMFTPFGFILISILVSLFWWIPSGSSLSGWNVMGYARFMTLLLTVLFFAVWGYIIENIILPIIAKTKSIDMQDQNKVKKYNNYK